MLKILKDNVKSLRNKSIEVPMPLSIQDRKTLESMIDYLIKSQDDKYCEKRHIRSGVGLAAPQIGINRRMFAIYYHKDEKTEVKYGLVNPKIIQNSVRKVAIQSGEGCLSVDEDKKGYVYRYHKIVMKAFDIVTNKDIEITATGYDAIVLQHEYDHLDGILYYDRIDKNNPYKEVENSYLI